MGCSGSPDERRSLVCSLTVPLSSSITSQPVQNGSRFFLSSMQTPSGALLLEWDTRLTSRIRYDVAHETFRALRCREISASNPSLTELASTRSAVHILPISHLRRRHTDDITVPASQISHKLKIRRTLHRLFISRVLMLFPLTDIAMLWFSRSYFDIGLPTSELRNN